MSDSVLVLTAEPYHENSTVLGVYRTVAEVQRALATQPGVKEIYPEPVEKIEGRWFVGHGADEWEDLDYEIVTVPFEAAP